MSNEIHIAQGDLSEAYVPFTLLAGDVPLLSTRSETILDQNAEVPQYTVLGRVAADQGDAANSTAGEPVFTGTGNGTLTLANPAVSDAVMAGTYKVSLVEVASDGGKFAVVRPDGTVDGYALVGVAYDGQIKFTIADGGTDFSGAAQFSVPVTISGGSAGKLVPCVRTATDGSQYAVAVLAQACGSASANADSVAPVYFSGHFNLDALVFDESFTTDEQKIAAFPDVGNLRASKLRYST